MANDMSTPCVHRWAPIGLWLDGYFCVPCLNPRCGAYLRRWAGRWVEVPQGFGPDIAGMTLDIEDDPQGTVAKIVGMEITRSYHLHTLDLPPGATIVDIGAHVGIVSCYLARRYPGTRVLAYEPQPDNFARLERNIAANGVFEQVQAFPLAVTGDGRPIRLHGSGHTNSGGWSEFAVGEEETAPLASTTLPAILQQHGLERVAVLKIDCEGAEYEILHAAGDLLRRVDYLVGEFHDNAYLQATYGGPAALRAYCQQYLPAERIAITQATMGASA
jgi:FkbM family methyltransferase